MTRMSAEDVFDPQPHLLAALGIFVLAGLVGVVLRFAFVLGMPAGWNFVNVRHAHSHVMYFGWGTLALMAVIYALLPDLTGRHTLPHPRLSSTQLVLTALFSLVALLPFALSGYEKTMVAGHLLPLSIAVSAVHGLLWYAFVVLYVQSRQGARSGLTLRCWDAAVAFLVLASVGAMARGVLSARHITDPFLTAASVHLFLDGFSDGWFTLALLGVFYERLNGWHEADAWRGLKLMVLGVPFTFLLGPPVDVVPLPLRLLAGLGGLLVVAGLGFHLRALAGAVWLRAGPVGWLWKAAWAALLVKALALLGATWPPLAAWSQHTSLLIFYLHVELLGFLTLGLAGVMMDLWNVPDSKAIRPYIGVILLGGGVGVMVASLLVLGLIGILGWNAQPWFWVAAWSSVAVVAGAVWLWGDLARPVVVRRTMGTLTVGRGATLK